MAKYFRTHISENMTSEIAWETLRNALETKASIEVIVNKIDNGFDLDVWNGIRKDGSNSEDADDSKEY